MRPPEDVQKLIRNAGLHSDPERNEAVLRDLLHQFDKTQEQDSAAVHPTIRRIIMNSHFRRIAIAASLALLVILPLGYGAAKIIQDFLVEREGEVRVYAAEDFSKEDAESAVEAARALVEKGEAEEVRDGFYRVTLPDGKTVEMGGKDAGTLAGFPPELRAVLEEIEQLRQTGDFEEKLIREWTEDDGTKISVYVETFTLSDGSIQKLRREERVRKTAEGEEKKIGITPIRALDARDAGVTISSSETFSQEEAKVAIQQAKSLIQEGKAEEIHPGFYRVTLPDGKIVEMNGDTAGALDLKP